MERLRPGWFLEGLFDAEYQQYRLLAYLRNVQRAFLAQRLYPPLSDMIASHAELVRLAEEVHQTPADSSPQIATLEEIITFSLPLLENAIEEGKTLYETIAKALSVHVVGVVPLYRDEGYLFLRRGTESIVRVYAYELRSLYDADSQVAIRLSYLRDYPFSFFALGFLRVRERLLKEFPHLPVPYTLAVESPWVLPLEETLLPIIQRSLPLWTKETPPAALG
ncbi:MAG: hypothetical protein N2253_00825 [Bacteroidia bacterium]|nr:hypothetical protein [Bacteroidia bacterium]MCX7763420.1 hypothetical protein [Bacteroidia bacterium]MDW8057585.1 hypothetical protein [Bacteroidia bacterium]